MPNKAGSKTLIIDCGANVGVYAGIPPPVWRCGLPLCPEGHGHCTAPRVGLLNNGTGGDQGPPAAKGGLCPPLTQAGQAGILHFVGNTEAREVPLGQVDVIVCDGYAGNVLLKSIEGTAMFMGSMMKRMFQKNLLTKLGALWL